MEYLQLIEILIPVVREVDKINSGVWVLAMHERVQRVKKTTTIL